jgi:hypothetical protein
VAFRDALGENSVAIIVGDRAETAGKWGRRIFLDQFAQTRDNLRRNDVTKIALLGTGGKMGLRLSTNLKDTRFDVDHVEVSAEGRASLKTVLGIECMEQGQAISSADALSWRCQTGGSGRSSRRSSRSPSGRQGRCA